MFPVTSQIQGLVIPSLVSGNVLYTDGTSLLWKPYFPDSTGNCGKVLSVLCGGGYGWITAGSGTITSVALSLPAIFTVSGSPVTTSGTLTGTLASQAANYFWAAPNGSSGAPAFRAIVAADVPTLNQNTAGSAATLTTTRGIYGNNFDGSAALTQIIASTYGGTGNGFTKFSGAASSEKTYTLPNASAAILTDNTAVTVAQGGTGQTSYTDGQLLIGNTTGNTLTRATLTGTSNEITVTNNHGSITLSTPQDIATGSSPTFSSLTLTNPLTEANGGAGWLTPYKVSGSDFTTSSSSLVDITGLVTGTLTDNTKYDFIAELTAGTSSGGNGAAGVKFGVNVTGTGSPIAYANYDGATTVSAGVQTMLLSGTNTLTTASGTFFTTASENGHITIHGNFTTGTSSVFSIQGLKNTGLGTLTVYQGSSLRIRVQ